MSARLTTRPRLAVVRRDSLFLDAYIRAGVIGTYDVFPDGREFVMLGRREEERRADVPLIVVLNWQATLRGATDRNR
jgi:hypothetical protein